jgi:hypothetical protein
MIQHFLATGDAQRTHKVLSKLARHDLSRWALTAVLLWRFTIYDAGAQLLSAS